MDIWVDAIQSTTDVLEFVSVMEIQEVSVQDDHLQKLKNLITAGWSNTKDELQVDLNPYWPYRDKLAVMDGVILKGRHIITPTSLK